MSFGDGASSWSNGLSVWSSHVNWNWVDVWNWAVCSVDLAADNNVAGSLSDHWHWSHRGMCLGVGRGANLSLGVVSVHGVVNFLLVIIADVQID